VPGCLRAPDFIRPILDLTFAQSRPKSRTKVAKICGRSRKVAEGRRTKKNDVMRIKVLRSLAMFSIKSRNVANQSRGKSRKVAQSRATSRATVATFRSRIGLLYPMSPTLLAHVLTGVVFTVLLTCNYRTSTCFRQKIYDYFVCRKFKDIILVRCRNIRMESQSISKR
jgi:hypothetical protein